MAPYKVTEFTCSDLGSRWHNSLQQLCGYMNEMVKLLYRHQKDLLAAEFKHLAMTNIFIYTFFNVMHITHMLCMIVENANSITTAITSEEIWFFQVRNQKRSSSRGL